MYSAKEIDLELPDDTDVDALKAQVDDALGDDDGVLWLTDRKGRQVGVAAGEVAFVELGSAADSERRIGFGLSGPTRAAP